MFYADVRAAVRFELNANLIEWVYQDLSPGKSLSERVIETVARRVELKCFSMLGRGVPFDLYAIILEEVQKPHHA
jgi:hypothetical protein